MNTIPTITLCAIIYGNKSMAESHIATYPPKGAIETERDFNIGDKQDWPMAYQNISNGYFHTC